MGLTLKFEFPKVSRARAVCTGVMASTLSTLWISAPWTVGALPLIPDGSTSPMLVIVGVLGPAGAGIASLLFAEARVRRDLKPADRRHLADEQPEPQPAPQRLRPRTYVLDEGHQLFGEAIEGEVLSR